MQDDRLGIGLRMQFTPGARVGRAGADLPVHSEHRHVETDAGVLHGDLLGLLIGDLRLFDRHDPALRHAQQRGGQQMRAVLGQTGQQFARGLMGADRDRGLGQDRAGVHAAGDAEHRGAGHVVARPDGALHRCGATPLRQQREMQVVPAHRQRVEHILLEQSAVRHHRGGFGAGGGQFGDEGLLARIGFDNRQPQFHGRLFDRAGHQPAAAPGRRVRTRQHGHHLEMLGIPGQRPQGGHRHIGGAGEQHLHHHRLLNHAPLRCRCTPSGRAAEAFGH